MNKKLLTMTALSFLAMYVLMYAMVDGYSNVYINLNQFYMVMAMTAAMVLIEVGIMKSMYSGRTKVVAIVLGTISIAVTLLFIRNQIAISDKEFMKSMISHHGAALLMCEEATIKDIEIQKLCEDIISSQQAQITWMKEKLSNLR